MASPKHSMTEKLTGFREIYVSKNVESQYFQGF